MSNSPGTAALTNERAAEFVAAAGSGRDRALSLLQEIEALAPGAVEQMAARIQLRRLRPTAGQ